jgi:ATP-dependent DNA helicase DinG
LISSNLSKPLQTALDHLQVGGSLSQSLKGFEARPQQQAMLQGVLQAYQEHSIALVEAGTGIGKSIAYLIPAILHAAKTGERTVISTNTITLQEQLVHKDIPLVLNALGLTIKAELVKGMGNYVCVRKMEEALAEIQLLPPEEAQELQRMETWLSDAKEGTLSELSIVPSYATRERTLAEGDA